jgi:ectoine hydroxylase-related dioxygenase (phytanoyl-CoA dioxygenase family)
MTEYLSPQDARLADLIAVTSEKTEPGDYPRAAAVRDNVLVYDAARLTAELGGAELATTRLGGEGGPRAVSSELIRALRDGPGIVVFAGAFPDPAVVDAASAEFNAMIADQRAAGGAAGDHFAAAGQNDRVWNALEKLALRAPSVFAAYYANDIIAAVSQAWLGPAYQVTSQVNVVNPGGAAQTPHRDYHLGFMTAGRAAVYPAPVHRLSPALTLQGAVAHSDMPVETGPTMYLPHSQKFVPGYLVADRPEFRAHFAANHVQLPLAKGDAVFFNPALLHAAGANRTADVRRMANLLQVSSAFGRAMEAVDRAAMSAAVYPALRAMRAAGAELRAVANVIAACAEGYPFPTNLDRDQPAGGMAPPSQAAVLSEAVSAGWPPERLAAGLSAWSRRRQTSG